MRLTRNLALLLAIASITVPAARAAGGPLGIDHRIPYDDAGIWGKAHQNLVLAGTALFAVGGALWEGDRNRFGHTLWQSTDAVVLAAAGTLVLKNVFQRARPEDTANPGAWFRGFGNQSFPSGHTAVSSAAITPIVLEYAHDHPWVWSLEAIPLYLAVGRVKTREHWQSDVLAGWALGTVLGWYAHSRKVPIMLSILPRGFAVGLHARF